MILDWLPNANHAALFAAEHIGAFSRQGLIVNLVAPSDPDLPARLVAAGQADLAISYGTQINMIDSAGLPLVRIATLINSPLNTVMALGDGKIRTLADLKGGKVGISVSGVEDALLAVMLQSVGLQPDDVTSVKINYGMVAALLTGHLDAAIGAYRNAEVLQVQQLGKKPIVFLPEEHGVPVYDELILVARRNSLGDPKLKRFSRCSARRHRRASKIARHTLDGVRCRPSRAFKCSQRDELENHHARYRSHSRKAGRSALPETSRLSRLRIPSLKPLCRSTSLRYSSDEARAGFYPAAIESALAIKASAILMLAISMSRPIQRNRAAALCCCFLHGDQNTTCLVDFRIGWGEHLVGESNLAGMDRPLPFVAEHGCAPTGSPEAVRVVEVAKWPIDRAQAVGAAGDQHAVLRKMPRICPVEVAVASPPTCQ